jgi:hypothetical protein
VNLSQYFIFSDLEGSYFDESGVGFANQRRDWMKHLDLDKTGTDLNLGGILGRLPGPVARCGR